MYIEQILIQIYLLYCTICMQTNQKCTTCSSAVYIETLYRNVIQKPDKIFDGNDENVAEKEIMATLRSSLNCLFAFNWFSSSGVCKAADSKKLFANPCILLVCSKLNNPIGWNSNFLVTYVVIFFTVHENKTIALFLLSI